MKVETYCGYAKGIALVNGDEEVSYYKGNDSELFDLIGYEKNTRFVPLSEWTKNDFDVVSSIVFG